MFTKAFLAGLFLNSASAWPTSPEPAHYPPSGPNQRALYVADNNPAGNNIIAAQIAQDGKLSQSVKISTGGKGLNQFVAASQDSVVVGGDYLFVTNAGDNTLSVFTIDPKNATNLKLLGKPMDTKGHTPASVTYSQELNVACALNSGDKAGVACFEVKSHGLEPLPFFLSIPQTELSDPAPSLPGALVFATDIRFNPSSTALLVTVRSNGSKPGILYSWPIHSGRFATQTVNNTLPDVHLPFSVNFLGSDSKVFLTNPHSATAGAAIMDLSPSGQVTHTQLISIPNQVAACWVAYDISHSRLFVVDAGEPTVTMVDSGNGKVTGQFNITTLAPGSGGQDTRLDRNFLYILTNPINRDFEFVAAPQVLVFDVDQVQSGGAPKMVQTFDVQKADGGFEGAVGLAVWPASRFT